MSTISEKVLIENRSLIPRSIIWPFILITSLFAWWGLANNMTDTLLAAFKRIMSMSDSQTALIQVVFYGAGYGLLAIPAAIFIRAMEPVEGVALMAKRRGYRRPITSSIVNLTNGPGKLALAMGITKNFYGADVCGNTVFFTHGEVISSHQIETTPRVNVDYAGEAKHYPWRFVVKESKFLSVKYRKEQSA